MDRWANMNVFARVARLGSFTRAAEELRMSTTAVSRRVSELEQHLGVLLLQRTTRTLHLTEEGQHYLAQCEGLLEAVEQLEAEVVSSKTLARGSLRITAGTSLTQEQLAPLLPEFCDLFPEVEVHLTLTDQALDLAENGIDVAIRVGHLQASSLRVRRLTICRHIICASPAYLKKHPEPRSVDELAHHRCVIDTNQSRVWHFQEGQSTRTFEPTGRFFVNHAHVAKQAVLAGVGIGLLPTFVAGTELASGLLVPLFEERPLYEPPVVALFAAQQRVPAKVRVFLDFLVEKWSPDAPWDSWMQTDGSEGI
ncbi:MAG: LysR family transcriptional regulator [Deltaproteobacteria bacterium]|nr:MAG: LysR family transcriptional regulator [Deltaproteobacteria bacterium]